MATSKSRLDKINEQVARQLSSLLREVKDPRVSGHMISVLRCEVTNDLRWCKVHLSILGDYDHKELMRGLKSCQGFLRSSVAKSLSLRYTPELTFVLDDSIAHGAHISKVLSSLDIRHDDGEQNPAEEESLG